jgi:transcriptional regulator with XRE-family HTH domain
VIAAEKGQEIRVGEKFRELRERKGLSLQESGEQAGYSSALISQRENPFISPPLGAMIKIAKALEVKVEAFFGEDPREPFTIVRKNGRRFNSRFASKEGVS